MAFVFYDTETTGISTAFDQILHFAAIRTDADLQELERFEIRCRLLPHVIPHPAALKVTGMTIARATDPSLPCHYEMIRTIQARMAEWSPAIFVGYNSLNFDEHLLRQALFRTLHAPYLTNTNGNSRADAMTLVQAASQFSPECVVIPTGPTGKAVFKLDQLAPANGFSHENAHDALADVEATIHMAMCVRERAPDCWSRFVRFSSKAGVNSFIDGEDAFVLTEFYFNKPYHYVVAPLGPDPDNSAAQLCLDLRHDLDFVASLSDDALATWVTKSPKPVRKVRTNAAPSIAPVDDVPSSFLGALAEDQIESAAERIRDDDGLRQRLIEAVMAGRDDHENSPHIEEQIYSGFVPDGDMAKMEMFHLVSWQDRVAIVDALEDERLRYYGNRLIHERHPELLTAGVREFYRTHDCGRLMDASGTAKWNTLLVAIAAIGETRVGCSAEQSLMLDEYQAYLQARIAAGG
jgi:exodeoxyribonuclease I